MTAVDKYRACAAARMSQAETARHLGVSRQAVQQMAKRYGLEFRPENSMILAPVRLEMIKAAAERGLSSDQIAEVTGLRVETINKRMRESGIPRKRKQTAHPRVDEIARLAATGMTTVEVARHLGIPQPNVSFAKKRFGIVFHRDGRSS